MDRAYIDHLNKLKKQTDRLLTRQGDRIQVFPVDDRHKVAINGDRAAFDRYEDWKAVQTLKGHPEWFGRIWEGTQDKQRRVWGFIEVKPGERLLEVGFRDGFNLKCLAEMGVKPVGVDVNPFAIEHGRAMGCEVYEEDIQRETRFAPGSFDVISACDVLEHCFAPEAALREIHRLLKDSGRAVVEIPFEAEFSDNLVHGHCSLFHNDERATALFIEAGFSVVKRDLSDSSRNLYRLHKRKGLLGRLFGR